MTCCKQWTLALECADGQLFAATRAGSYATFAQAVANAKDAEGSAPSSCQSPRPKPVCARGATEASPTDGAAQGKTISVLDTLAAREDALATSDAALRTFFAKRVLSTKGMKAGQTLSDRSKTTRRALLAARFTAERARTPEGTEADAERAGKEAHDASELATRLEADVRAYMDDPQNIDAAAEAKERARLEAAEAARRKKAEAEEEARQRAEAQRAAIEAQKAAAQARAEEGARQRAEAESRRAEATRMAAEADAQRKAAIEAHKVEVARLAAEADAKRRADAEAKERARQDAERAANEKKAEATRKAAAAAAAAAAAEESTQRAKMDRDFSEADSRVRNDLDQCSQSIATLTMIEMSSRGQAKVSEMKIAIQNHKDKLRALLGRLTVAKGKVPLKAAAEDTAQCNEESKALARETAKLVAAAKALKS